MMKRIDLTKKHALAGLGAIVAIGLAALAYYRAVYLPSSTAIGPGLPPQGAQTVVVQQGELLIYARGSGVLVAPDHAFLGFGTSGSIATLNVAPGDMVHQGDVLATQADREQLKAAVQAQELAAMKAEQVLESLYQNADLVAAQAALDLANAQAALHTAEYKRSVQQEGNRASPAAIDSARANLVIAKDNLRNAKADYDQMSGRRSDDPQRAIALAAYANAQKKYNSALRNWNWYTGHPTEIQQAQLDAEVALAEANLAQAQSYLEKVGDGPDPDEIALAELQLAIAKTDLSIAQENFDRSMITAPADGTIVSVTGIKGQEVSGPFIEWADLSQLYVDFSIDATEINKINLDDAVEIVFDALPNQTFAGRVVKINPILQSQSQVPTISGQVKLDESAANDKLVLGMKAAVDIISYKAEGATLVPVAALDRSTSGAYVVHVLKGDSQELRTVEVGRENATYAEIISGLTPGEVIVVGVAQSP